MDASTLEAEQASIEEDILKLQLHSVALDLEWDAEQEEEVEEEEPFEESYFLTPYDDPDQPSTSGLNAGASTSGFGTSSGPRMIAADSEDDEEPPQGEEEGELIDLSVDLVANPQNLLKLNIAYQEVIQQQLHLIDILLEQNTVKKDELEGDMEDSCYGEDKKSAKADLGLCLAPFFKNNTFIAGGFPATVVEIPPHPDVDRRHHELGEQFAESPMPPIKWKKDEEKKLKSAVCRVSLRKIITPLMSQLEYLEEKFAKSGNPEQDKKIKDIRNKIDTARATESCVLFGNRDVQHDWAAVSNIDFESMKTASECALHWQNNLHPSINKKQWTPAEDANLKHIVKKYKEKNWKNIAMELATGRTPMQCIQRYQRNNTEHKGKPWTPEEDERMKKLVEKYRAGSAIPYTLVALKMGTRSGNQVCHRWTKTIDPIYKKSKWTVEEDMQLLQAIVKYGPRWSVIRDSGMVPGRNDAQSRERWDNTLRNINHDPWTREEDKKLTDLIAKHGEGQWAMIALAFDRRTDNQILNRWKYQKRFKEKGLKIQYRKKGPKTIVDGLQEVRQKLIDTIEKQMADKKKGFNGSVPENPPMEAIAAAEEDKFPRDVNQPVASLSSSQVIRIPPTPRTLRKFTWMGTELQKRMKAAQKPEEIIEIYKDICNEVRDQKGHPKARNRWIRTDRIINEKIHDLIASKYRPFNHDAMTEGTNIHEIRQKVLLTSKKITSKVMFIHYVKAMNINAEKTLRAIKEPETTELQTASTKSPAKKGKRKRPTSTDESAQAETTCSETSTPAAETNSQSFVRNHMLHLCAPNRATLSGYRRLMQDRERRVKTAKLMLLDKNTKSKVKKVAINAGETSEKSTNGYSNSYEGEKYRPEVLMKNIQLMPEHRILRSRFVSLFAWATVLSTLVPYERVGNFRALKPAVRIKRKTNERKEDDAEEPMPPNKRQRQQN